MTPLNTLIMEIHQLLNAVPQLNPRICWRLHPDDLAAVRGELQTYCQERDQLMMPVRKMHILGVRIVKDSDAPRLGINNATSP